MIAQQLLEGLATPRRLRRQQHAALVLRQVGDQACVRGLRLRVHRELRGRTRGEAHAAAGAFAVYLHAPARLQALGERLRAEKQLRGRERRSLGVEPCALVALLDLCGGARGGAGDVAVQHPAGVARQVVEQRRRGLEEQRQVVLDARRRVAAAHLAVDALALRVALEAPAKRAAEPLDAWRRHGELPRRQQLDRGLGAERALRFGVEVADGLDLVAEKIEPERVFGAHGEDVHEPAAHGVLAGRHDLTHGMVGGTLQARAQRVHVEALADVQHEALAGDVVARRQALHQVGDGDDDDAARELDGTVQGEQAPRDDVGVRREDVVGQALPVGQRQDGDVAPRGQVEGELVLEQLRLARVLGDDRQRATAGAGRLDDGEAAARARQARPDQPLGGRCGHRRREGRGRAGFGSLREHGVGGWRQGADCSDARDDDQAEPGSSGTARCVPGAPRAPARRAGRASARAFSSAARTPRRRRRRQGAPSRMPAPRRSGAASGRSCA